MGGWYVALALYFIGCVRHSHYAWEPSIRGRVPMWFAFVYAVLWPFMALADFAAFFDVEG